MHAPGYYALVICLVPLALALLWWLLLALCQAASMADREMERRDGKEEQ